MNLKNVTEIETPQEIVELWKSVRRQVVECLKKTPAQEFVKVPEPGKWCISEVGEHIYISQMNTIRSVPIVLAGKFGSDTDEQKDLNYDQMMSFFIKPTGVKNPQAVAPLNKYTLEELLPLLDKAEKKMESVLEKTTKSQLQKRGMEHPYFKMLNLFNFLWVMYMHEYSHLVALKEKTAKF